MAEKNNYLLHDSTILEVVAIKGEDVIVKEMSYSEWKLLKRKSGFRYMAFQVGFSQFKINK